MPLSFSQKVFPGSASQEKKSKKWKEGTASFVTWIFFSQNDLKLKMWKWYEALPFISRAWRICSQGECALCFAFHFSFSASSFLKCHDSSKTHKLNRVYQPLFVFLGGMSILKPWNWRIVYSREMLPCFNMAWETPIFQGLWMRSPLARAPRSQGLFLRLLAPMSDATTRIR